MKATMTTTRRFLLPAFALLMFGPALAGPLDPPGVPAPTGVTLQQIYDAIKPPGCFNNNPSGLRFVDCGNGTVQDVQSGLVWLKNANCLTGGSSDWASANRRASKLADGSVDGNTCGLADGSKAGMWRLPTQAEWQAIVLAFPTACNPALPDATGAGCYTTGAWATSVQSGRYWSSSAYTPDPIIGYYGDAGVGGVNIASKTNNYFVWPVRTGP